MSTHTTTSWILALAVAATLLPLAAHAEVINDVGNEDNPEAKVEPLVAPKLSLFPIDAPLYDALQDQKRQLKDKTGLELALESTTIYQIASGSRPANDAIETTTAIFGTWTFFRQPNSPDAMGLGFAAESRVNYNGDSFTDMTRDLGSLWAPNDSTSDDYNKINQLWFGQRLADGKFAYVIGKVDPGSFLNGNRFAGSGNTQFFSQPFATNPARSFADNGLGAVGRFSPVSWVQLQAEISDGDANSTHSPFTSIHGNWFKAGEVVFIPQIPNLGEGRYRFLVYQQDSQAAITNGWALSFDQNLTSSYGVFLRYGGNDGKVNPIEHLISAGFSWLTPFGRPNDQAGIGVSWTRPSDHSLRDEYSSEIYYRLQLTHFIDISANAELLFHPPASQDEVIGVYGIRLHVLF